MCVFLRLKGCFGELIKDNGKVLLIKVSGTFGSIPMKANLSRSELREIWCPTGPKASTMAVL